MPVGSKSHKHRLERDYLDAQALSIAALLPTTTAADAKMSGGAEGSANVTLTDALVRGRGKLLKTPTSQLAVNGGSQHPDKRKAGGHGPTLADEVEHLLPTVMYLLGAERSDEHRPQGEVVMGAPTNWGPYEPAIRRWEAANGPAPAPTEPNAKGNHRLSPRFTEWMMGVPAGWITGTDISRNEQLKAAGNGVVPQQAAAALVDMLAAFEEKAEAA